MEVNYCPISISLHVHVVHLFNGGIGITRKEGVPRVVERESDRRSMGVIYCTSHKHEQSIISGEMHFMIREQSRTKCHFRDT